LLLSSFLFYVQCFLVKIIVEISAEVPQQIFINNIVSDTWNSLGIHQSIQFELGGSAEPPNLSKFLYNIIFHGILLASCQFDLGIYIINIVIWRRERIRYNLVYVKVIITLIFINFGTFGMTLHLLFFEWAFCLFLKPIYCFHFLC